VTTPNPSWDPATRARVQQAMDHLYAKVSRILQGHSDVTGGLFDADSTSDVIGHGDITGIVAVSTHGVIEPIRRELDEASAVLHEVIAETDAWKRAQYGPAYRPAAARQRKSDDR